MFLVDYYMHNLCLHHHLPGCLHLTRAVSFEERRRGVSVRYAGAGQAVVGESRHNSVPFDPAASELQRRRQTGTSLCAVAGPVPSAQLYQLLGARETNPNPLTLTWNPNDNRSLCHIPSDPFQLQHFTWREPSLFSGHEEPQGPF